MFSLGVEFDKFDKKPLNLDPTIEASMLWNAFKVTSEYNYMTGKGFDAGAGLSIGRQWAKLNLSDGSQSLTYSAAASTLSPSLWMGWTAKSNFGVRLALRYATGVFDFGDPGTIDTRRSEVMLNGLFRFGGFARRL